LTVLAVGAPIQAGWYRPAAFCPTSICKLSGIRHGLAVELGDDIAGFQASFSASRIGIDLSHNGSGRGAHLEELGVIRD